MSRWMAPWSEELVITLEEHQKQTEHPYTCGNDSGHPPLVPTGDGWVCDECDYTQDWAHDHTPSSNGHKKQEEGPTYATPLHELVSLANRQGVSITLSFYLGTDEHAQYLGGGRLTGYAEDPMSIVHEGIRGLRQREAKGGEVT